MNFLSTLGLCRKSGKLIHGFDPVCDELKNPKSKIAGVVIAKDVSEKRRRKCAFSAISTKQCFMCAKIRWTRSKTLSESAQEYLPFSMRAYTKALQGNKR